MPTPNRPVRLLDVEIAELRALEGQRQLAVHAANNVARYCTLRLHEILQNHDVAVDDNSPPWVLDLISGFAIPGAAPAAAASSATQETK